MSARPKTPLLLPCRIVRQMVDETYENDDEFDVTYVVIVLVALLPAAVVPAVVCQWILIGSSSAALSIRHFAKLCSDDDSDASGSAIGEQLIL